MLLTLCAPWLNTLFPAECQICRQPRQSGVSVFCTVCMPRLEEQALTFGEAFQDTPPPSIRSAWSAFRYQDAIRDLLHRVKFNREFYLLNPLAQKASDLFEAILSATPYDAIIPVPVHWSRRWERRFNQAEITAREWARQKKIPVETRCLFKRFAARPQSGLTQEERRWNLYGAFGARFKHRIRGRRLLLVDDIITTGTTASEAARTLRDAGALQVDLLTLARSEKKLSQMRGMAA